jgi:hypothetical protein
MSGRNPTRLLQSFAAGLLLGISAAPAFARPSMWWDHFEAATQDQAECVRQAEAILTGEKAGELSVDSDSVRVWTEKTVAVAECIRFGERLLVAVLISSEDPAAGNRFFNALRSGMKAPAGKPAGK